MKKQSIFEYADAVVIFDTETSGLKPGTDQIIELAALRIEPTKDDAGRSVPTIVGKMDTFIKLPTGQTLAPNIVELTHITDEILAEQGTEQEEAARTFAELATLTHGDCVILAAHNAQFDLHFLGHLLRGHKIGAKLAFLDTLTVYRDRRKFPHKLADAIAEYKLTDKVQNSHRAIDDAIALFEVIKAMEAERADLCEYFNVFGYNPKYGISGGKLRNVRYVAQPYRFSMAQPFDILPTKR